MQQKTTTKIEKRCFWQTATEMDPQVGVGETWQVSCPSLSLSHSFTHTCSHTFTHVHTRSHTFTHVHTRSCTFTHVHTYVYIHLHMFTHVHTRSHMSTHDHTRSCTFTHVFTHMFTHIHICSCTFMHVHTCSHTCSHTFTHCWCLLFVSYGATSLLALFCLCTMGGNVVFSLFCVFTFLKVYMELGSYLFVGARTNKRHQITNIVRTQREFSVNTACSNTECSPLNAA